MEFKWVREEGVWKSNIYFSKHNNEINNYTTHVNGYDSNNNPIFLTSVIVNVSAGITSPCIVSQTDPSFDVNAYGVSTEATQVSFPNWSEVNGQDDLEFPWLSGIKVKEGLCKATIFFSKQL